MAGAPEIISSLKHIINNWANTQMPLESDANAGDTLIEIKNTNRFRAGDEVMIRDPIVGGEFENIITEIHGDTLLELANPLHSNWTVDQAAVLQKTFEGDIIAGIYTGEPDNIPFYPAITVNAKSVDSDWLTIDSTKEDFKIDVVIYSKAAAQEKGYITNLKLTETIKLGLKMNIYPLVAPYTATSATTNIDSSDIYIRVDSTDGFIAPGRVIIEDEWKQSELIIKSVVDDHILELTSNPGCNFLLADNPIIIFCERFIYNSWPASVTFGEVFKGTLLKAARISWFAWEELIWLYPPRETHLH